MKLKDIIEKAKAEGYTHYTDEYCYRAKKIEKIDTEADQNQYGYYDGEATQLSEYPSNHYTFYRVEAG